MSTNSGRSEGLEKRVKHLEDRVSILAEMADFKGHPFLFTVLEHNITKEQIEGIYVLMCKVDDSLKSSTPMNHVKFERELSRIVPLEEGSFSFAKDIVMTLNDEDRWKAVYLHLKEDGMNI